MLMPDMVYKAASYLRLSKEDGDFSVSPGKQESNSISSQRDMITRYVDKMPDIELVAEFSDDGYTGTNFDRPNFQKMMTAVKSGEVNCIIVKDLSRFGRDYIGSGRYIEKLFPQLGVRFIAINDHYDSALRSSSDSIILPFKNLINDSYSRDISIKVRSNLENKRQRGEFIANFPVYGYKRDEQDKNRLVVDEYAASVVRDIFRWKIEGMSAPKIAAKLNERGILSPMEYKKANGSRYQSKFKTSYQAGWSAVSITRILTNPVYTGTLVQGRRTTPNYKVKLVITKAESEWARVEGTHEAIVHIAEYNLVQELLKGTVRSAAGSEGVHPLSGKVFCGECGKAVKRTTVSSGGKKYAYYNCPNALTPPTKRKGQIVSAGRPEGCAPCRISEGDLESAVLATLRTQIDLILDMEQALKQVEALAWENRECSRLDAEIAVQQEIIEKNNQLKAGVYEDLRDDLISKEEYNDLKAQFSVRIEQAQAVIERLAKERDDIRAALSGSQGWLAQFRKYKNITELNRALIVTLVERVDLYPNREIGVVLRHKNQFADMVKFLENRKNASQQEAREAI